MYIVYTKETKEYVKEVRVKRQNKNIEIKQIHMLLK